MQSVVARAQRTLVLVAYERQKTVLQDLLTKAGEDVYVATYGLVERPDKSVWSWASWVRQVTHGLLPEVDYLAVGDVADKTNKFFVAWDDAVTIAADTLVLEPGYDPPRWRHHGWASEDVMEQLRARSVPAGGVAT